MIHVMPKELIKLTNAEFDVVLGFSLTKFSAGYQKDYFFSGFTPIEVVMQYTNEEMFLFSSFFKEVLKYGTESFRADLNIGFGEKEYLIKQTPRASILEADIYQVKLSLVQKDSEQDDEASRILRALRNIERNLQDINLLTSANVEPDFSEKRVCLALINLYNLVSIDDINEFSKFNSLTDRLISNLKELL